jgi:copper(I)-binding protein
VAARTDFTQPAIFQAPVLAADGTLVVRDMDAIQIAPGQSLTLQPGSIRLVLNDVQRRLEGGEHFDLVLEFETAGPATVEVEIEHHDETHRHGPSS